TIRTWDGSAGLGHCCAPDIFNVVVDGAVLLSETFWSTGDGPGPHGSYIPSPGVYVGRGAGFPSYEMGNELRFQNIPHIGSSLTVQWFASGGGWQRGDDEYWAIDNVSVTEHQPGGTVPEAGSSGWLLTGACSALLGFSRTCGGWVAVRS